MIQFTNNTIIITGQTVDTEAIYQACVSAGLDWVVHEVGFKYVSNF